MRPRQEPVLNVSGHGWNKVGDTRTTTPTASLRVYRTLTRKGVPFGKCMEAHRPSWSYVTL